MIRIGDFVLCIDDRDCEDLIRKGQVYQVTDIYDKFLTIDALDVPYGGFYQSRFRPAPSIEGLRKLLNEQEPLGPEFERVLFDNLWDLYAR
jgi:hypothetical protein